MHYLDHAASTPMRPVAIEALARAARELPANPSGAHGPARAARRALDDARDQIADIVGADPGEVVFTSGGTEADDLAVRGVTAAQGGVGACSAVEHPAVRRPTEDGNGILVGVDPLGRLDLDALAEVIARRAIEQPGRPLALLSVMVANNETGVVNDLAAISVELDRLSPTTVLHTDAVAAAAWLDLRSVAAPAALLSVSGHKVGGPKGIGVLVVRDGTPFLPRVVAGGQERERRGGTPNLTGALSFAAALGEAANERDETVARVGALQQRLITGLVEALPGVLLTTPTDPSLRTPGTVHVCIPGVAREALLFLLDEAGIAASWGSSCASGASSPSEVLAAMGVPDDLAEGSLRLSLGWCSTDADVDAALREIPAAVARLGGEVTDPTPVGASVGASTGAGR